MGKIVKWKCMQVCQSSALVNINEKSNLHLALLDWLDLLFDVLNLLDFVYFLICFIFLSYLIYLMRDLHSLHDLQHPHNLDDKHHLWSYVIAICKM
jgi:hypothetical protein